jgi:hypothetical protein
VADGEVDFSSAGQGHGQPLEPLGSKVRCRLHLVLDAPFPYCCCTIVHLHLQYPLSVTAPTPLVRRQIGFDISSLCIRRISLVAIAFKQTHDFALLEQSFTVKDPEVVAERNDTFLTLVGGGDVALMNGMSSSGHCCGAHATS